jgi:hypothetical protein
MSVHSEGKRHFLCKMQNSPTTPAGVETEQTSQKLKEVIRYLPKLLLRKALSDPDTVATQPAIDVFQSAVLIADITGFTPLTERALTSKRGSELVEELTVSMNNYFDEVCLQFFIKSLCPSNCNNAFEVNSCCVYI